MKFNFEKLGYVDKGSIDIGDLTLICGPNNVGKTYASHGIYGFIDQFKKLVDLSLPIEEVAKLKDEGSLIINLEEYQQKLSTYMKNASEKYSGLLGDYFNTPDDFFSESKIDFSGENSCIELVNEFKMIANYGNREKLIFDKASNETTLSVVLEVKGKSKLPNRVLNDVISDGIAEYIFSNIFPEPFVVTSERTGIALFYKELDISKNVILEHLAESDRPDPISLLNSIRSRYARPIQDNIDVIRDYENLSKHRSFIRRERKDYKYVLDALQDLLGGSFKAVDKQVFYLPKKERNRDKVAVPVYLASSAIKSLFLIDLYINCLAEKRGLLIIDEPELNLHPDNQRKMAGLLARLVNAGIKVMISTHSDYLIREINNRIMLSNQVYDKESIMKTNKMVKQDILTPEQVKAFNFREDHSIKEVSVDRYGVNMEIFDDLIADTNILADNIYYNIEES